MKNYVVKNSEYKPLEGKKIGLEPIKNSPDPFVRRSELNKALKETENRIYKRMDSRFNDLKKFILNQK